MQLNSILFSKTLVRKDIASTGSGDTTGDEGSKNNGPAPEGSAEKPAVDDFSSKAQIMTLMTTDVDRVSGFSWHLFTLVGESPIRARKRPGVRNHLQMPPLRSLLEHSSCTAYSASPVYSDYS